MNFKAYNFYLILLINIKVYCMGREHKSFDLEENHETREGYHLMEAFEKLKGSNSHEGHGERKGYEPRQGGDHLLPNQLLAFLKNVLENLCALNQCNVLVSVDRSLWQKRVFVDGILKELLRNNENVAVILRNGICEDFQNKLDLKLYFIVNEHSINKIHKDLLTKSIGRLTSKYLLVLLNDDPWPRKRRILSKIFQHFFSVYLLDVTVITINDEVDMEAYTFFPYSDCGCNHIEPVLLQNLLLSNGSINPRSLFPNKLSNGRNCPLKVVTWEMEPFVSFYQSSIQNTLEFNGYDITLLRLLASKFNFSLDIELNQPANLLGGDIFANGTVTGAYKTIRDREANITIGCSSCKPERMRILSPSLPYFSMQYVLLVRTSEAKSSFELFFLPFDPPLWMLFLSFPCARAMLYVLTRKFKNLISLNSRIFIAAWLISMFVFRTSYESCFFRFMQIKTMKPLPLSLEAISAQNYTIIVDHAKYRVLEHLPKLQSRTQIIDGEPIEIISAINRKARIAIFTSNAFLSEYISRFPYEKNQVATVAETIMTSVICIYYPRNSYLVGIFDEYLLRLHEAGISYHLYEMFKDTSRLPRKTDSPTISQEKYEEVLPIDVKTLLSIFLLLLSLEGIAVLIFIFELLHSMISKKLKLKIFRKSL